jgi:hypothetical protein
MATISDKNIIVEMLNNRGEYHGDPAPNFIYEYTNPEFGGQHFALFYPGDFNDIYDSPFVTNPVLLFYMGELTDAGHVFVTANKKPLVS